MRAPSILSSLALAAVLFHVAAGCAPRPLEAPAPPAEALAPAEPLPRDPAIRTGRLPNGLTYFVRRNAEPQHRAELRLVVNAGSVLEEEDQRGLAHFVEHMAFRGTERFPEQELVNFLERIGMRFGPDVNAYTSFDETVFMLQVPTDDADLLDTGLTILREWAGSVTFADDKIEAERGVILEEWRSGLGAAGRIRDQHFSVLLGGSRYAERLPIGLPEVIRDAPPERLRDFYRDWYRPELMAVVAVGDFDPDEVAAAIRERFADLANAPGAPAREEFGVPPHDETRIAIATDPEQTLTVVQLVRTLPARPRQTVEDFREHLVDQLYVQMLNARLREITQRPGAPFLGASAFQGGFVRPVEAIGMAAVAPEGGVPRALEALLVEAARVRLHGFTETELGRAKANIERAFRRAFEEREQRPSADFAARLVSYYLRGGSVPAIETEFALARALLPTIDLREIDARAAVIAAQENRVVLVAAPEKAEVPAPDEAELRAVLATLDEDAIEPYIDAVVAEALIPEPPAPGDILSESRYADDGIVEWTLGNGITVVVRQTDFRNDEVLFSGFRPGGTSVVSDDRFRAAEMATAAVIQGGVGDFSLTDLERALAGLQVRVSPFLASREEGFSGSASPEDLETLLQLVHLYFTAPRRDAEAFESHRERMVAVIHNRAANPLTAFSDTLVAVLAQHHPRSRPLTVEDVLAVDLEQALEVYTQRFSDASQFTFVFVGAVEPDSLAPLVKRYLATLPARDDTLHAARDLGIRPPEGVVTRTIHRGLEPQAHVALVFSGELRHDPRAYDPQTQEAAYHRAREEARWERFRLRALADALSIRLREELREELGGVYGVSVGASPDRFTGTYTLSVSFGADPDRVEELIAAVFAEIETFASRGPADDVVTRVVERGRRAEETELRSNRYWQQAIANAYRHGEAPRNHLFWEDLRQRLTAEVLRDAARQFIDPGRHVRVVLLPEERAGT